MKSRSIEIFVTGVTEDDIEIAIDEATRLKVDCSGEEIPLVSRPRRTHCAPFITASI